MNRNYLFIIGIIILCWSCGDQKSGNATNQETPVSPAAQKSKAQDIVNQGIAKHGGDLYNSSIIKFTFRDRQYKARMQGSSFQYERLFTDSVGRQVRDILNNGGFYREINGKRVTVDSLWSRKYTNSVNSVLYFALLPAHLNDPAVIKDYLGEVTIKGKPYHKIKVTFQQEGGGEDFEDEYVYWFNRDSLTMDYLAYNYREGGGGARFREAYNVRNVNGIRFEDYVNYAPKDSTNLQVATFDRLFENDGLKAFSKIETENIEVIHLK